jgi:hypothetical protein
MVPDPTDPAAAQAPLADSGDYPSRVEIARVWVHLPSGAAAVQGIVRHPDGGPIVAGARFRARPIVEGGTHVLETGAPPNSPDNIAPLPTTQWAMTDPGEIEPMLTNAGWRLITRAEAVKILIAQGYRLRDSTQAGHVAHLDLNDEVVWHANDNSFAHMQAAFVIRHVLLRLGLSTSHALTVAVLADDDRAGTDGETPEETREGPAA